MAKMMDIEQAESVDTVIVNSPTKVRKLNEVEATADYGIISTVRQLLLLRSRSIFTGNVPLGANNDFYLGADPLRDVLRI